MVEEIKFVFENADKGIGAQAAGATGGGRPEPPTDPRRDAPVPSREPPPSPRGEGGAATGRQALTQRELNQLFKQGVSAEFIRENLALFERERDDPRRPAPGTGREAPAKPSREERDKSREEDKLLREKKKQERENVRAFSDQLKILRGTNEASNAAWFQQRAVMAVLETSTVSFHFAARIFAAAVAREAAHGRFSRAAAAIDPAQRQRDIQRGVVPSIAVGGPRVPARLGAMGGRLGFSGGAATVAGGAAVAGAVGIGAAIAGVALLGIAAVKTVRAIDRWTDELESSARSLVPFSGRLAVGVARLDVARMMRQMQTARIMEPSLAAGLAQTDRLEREIHELGLRVGSDIQEFKNAIIGIGAGTIEKLNGFFQYVEDNKESIAQLLMDFVPLTTATGLTLSPQAAIVHTLLKILKSVDFGVEQNADDIEGLPGDLGGMFGLIPDFVVPGFNDQGEKNKEVFPDRRPRGQFHLGGGVAGFEDFIPFTD